MANKWLEFLKAYHAKNKGKSYKENMKAAAVLYKKQKKGGASASSDKKKAPRRRRKNKVSM